MGRKLTDSIGLKIISLVIGILIWILVANIDDPVISKSFTLTNVELMNEAYIDDTGKVCLRNDQQAAVRVTITGERKKLSRISADDIRLTADLQQAVSLDTDPVMIPITATCSGIQPGNITVSPQNYSVRLEDKVTSEFLVSVSNGESKTGRGYEVGTQSVSPEKVRITGPKSLMSKIDKVNAVVDLHGATEDFSVSAGLTVIDKNADALSESQRNNLRLENDGKVTVSTKLWKTRSDIRLDVSYTGRPSPGFMVSSITTVPETISIAGDAEALEDLAREGNAITIGGEELNVTGADSDREVKVDLTPFLPENIRLTSGSANEVLVTFSIIPDGSEVFTIPTSEIKVNNKPEKLQISFEIDKVEVRVKAQDGDMSSFDRNKMSASIDLENKKEGTYEVPVEIELPEGYELINNVSTEVSISKVSVVEETEE